MKYRHYVEHVLVTENQALAGGDTLERIAEALAAKKMLRRPLDEEGDVEIVTQLDGTVVRETWIPESQRPHKHPRGGM